MCTNEIEDGLAKKGLRSKPQLIAEALYKHDSEAKKVLDVGYAQHPNYHLTGEIIGVDIYTEHHPEHYERIDTVDLNLCALPYEDGVFDAATMGCVLAHVTNPLGLLNELHRVVKKDGYVVLSSPNPNYYWEQSLNTFFHFFKGRVAKSKFLEHFYEFTRYNMRTIADRAGFEVVDEVGVSFRIIKTPIVFQPRKYPGIAYEIVYVLKKTHDPEQYTICELADGRKKLPTMLK
tara:strand:- start:5140 stop:5838 length:699 start_codon:yes stop_codon:yes gene_type:complete